MILEVRRKKAKETKLSVGGELWVDGQFECHTLEPARERPIHEGHPCVAAGGPYKVELTLSPHFGFFTPEVLGVPDRSNIRVHPANEPGELLGCTAVGMSWAKDWVSESKKAFLRLMVLLRTSNDGWTLEYKEEKDDAAAGS